MSDPHREAIWQREDARQIMNEARRQFEAQAHETTLVGRATAWSYPASAHVALASTHYSLVKRYMSPKWKVPLAVWHTRRAVVHAKAAISMGGLNFDQVDVVTKILSKAPSWLGGDRKAAQDLLLGAIGYVPVAEPQDEMLAHTRALLLITLGEIEEKMGATKLNVAKRYLEAMFQRKLVFGESDKLMAMRQWVRIAAACGFWFYDHRAELEVENEAAGGSRLLVSGFIVALLPEAYALAEELAEDQAEKIRAECQKRGLDPDNLLPQLIYMCGESAQL
ncbi:hypothetical protein KW785_00425 [Candidatus Parcubacteria bacterium]|nr:hypothetical protein [Candidatus Parcubacteria bacterium]